MPAQGDQQCIVPAQALFQTSYETEEAVRWRNWQPGRGADQHRGYRGATLGHI